MSKQSFRVVARAHLLSSVDRDLLSIEASGAGGGTGVYTACSLHPGGVNVRQVDFLSRLVGKAHATFLDLCEIEG